MTVFGFHASHEQISPAQLLQDVQAAEQAGFDAAMASDHHMPWSARQGHSGFTLSWLGAALATTSLRIGHVAAPGQRYHPAILAQAIGTLGQMFPGRYWTALGAGQAMNEHVTGDPWPDQQTRRRRLEESADVIHRLLQGETVSHTGLIRVDRAHVYDRPETPSPLLAACITPESARRAAAWAQGMITLNQGGAEHDVQAAYREAGGRGPVALQVHLSWAPTEEEALAIARDQWSANTLGPPLDQDLPTPEYFDAASREISADTVREAVRISADPSQHVAWISDDVAAGFDEIYLHHVGQVQQPWLDLAGAEILPALRS